MPSFLDILVPSRVPDTGGVRRSGPADVESSIRHDIQVLLNARRPSNEFWRNACETESGATEDDLDRVHQELRSSVFNFGVNDFAFADMKDREQRAEAARHIAAVIVRFEPRLTDVRVEAEDPEEMETRLRFRIFARLRGTNGESDFHNVFEWTTGHHEVTTA
jgi:type VI secretion system lysozyme-like protein